MTTEYTIYLVNNSSRTELFWCFLARPEELVNDPNVFANSNTNLSVSPNYGGINTFTIPVEYILGAGATNNAVAPNIRITSSITKKAKLTETWEAKYFDVPPYQGPEMSKSGSISPANTLSIESSPFEQQKNEAQGWFANMSFGIQTLQGFIGMTWSPAPNKKRILTPKLEFYVSIGDYGSNSLADWNEVSRGSAVISVPGSFDILGNTTVTYSSSGKWTVTPGKPPVVSDLVSSLIQSHQLLSKAHTDLAALVKVKQYSINESVNDVTAKTVQINDGNSSNIDLGNSTAMNITAKNGNAMVYVDYLKGGKYSSAIKPSAGYSSPFIVKDTHSKTVLKSDLESENVRVSVENADIVVTY
ncbi:hypothetical protein [Nostoc sp. FACHB-280]|uniref:hypothetical protein n=1 Tax=Nostoc sp. FACHB-280 TaxID=2692839 RepID=UPI00168BEA3D|nr:hypothetical protein [Nostoc sp. FACHB-280]MBD2492837.1 hypothetical protein [Nostoc sp. FACHB-280]